MTSPIQQKIGSLLAAKLQSQSGARVDMYLADRVPVSASSSNVLIGYTPRFGKPTAQQVVAFISHKLGVDVDAKLETLQALASADGRKAGLAVVVAPKPARIDIRHKDDMIAVSSTMFMDQKIGANWDVKQGPDGVEFLECTRAEDVNKLLNTAIASQGALSGTIRFGEQGVTASVETNVGDFVEFYTEQGLRRGDVTKVGPGEKVSILADDRQWVVDQPAVLKVLRLNPKAEEEKNKQIESFYATIWDHDFAKQLVRNTPAKGAK
jgi:hypothetical protein